VRAIVTRLLPDNQREKALVADFPEPGEPRGNEILCKTVFTGITNGTERNQLIRGNYAPRDEDLPAAGGGYQNVGRVIHTGPEVTQLNIGDLIYASCDHVEQFKIPETGLLVKLPPEVEPAHAALFGMGSVAMHACRRIDLKIGEELLIVGQGCIGLFAAQIAQVLGAKVTVCDINASRLQVARQINVAERIVNTNGDGWQKEVAKAKFDAVIDLAGVPNMVDEMIKVCKHRGRLILIAGRFKVDYTFNVGQGHEIGIFQSSHFTRDDLENLCRLVARGLVRVSPFIRHQVKVDQASQIYSQLRDEPGKLLGTVFIW